ncbi:MAG: 6-pyruvoyl tetrahydropterin synthase [Alphaproteobacteria bacterium]|nr:6-pyruvoyl tetrahydropterin synthase [Alphaproteobacteria bacterium]
MAALEFSRRYAMAHRLLADPQSKCATPHGHNEFVTVTLAPKAHFVFSGANHLARFEDIKRRWHGWIDGAVDHALQLNEADPLIDWFRAHEPQRMARILTLPGDPTTEALAAAFFLKLSAFLREDALPFTVESVRVEETPTNAVVLSRAHFDPDACGAREGSWPLRADMSVNDF